MKESGPMPEATRALIAGEAHGEILELDEPLSFWGGFESETGTIIDQAHPQVGQSLVGKIVMMTVGRGSSSASSVLAEAIRDGTAPAALILQESDEIYGTVMPILLVDDTTYRDIASLTAAQISADGQIDPR